MRIPYVLIIFIFSSMALEGAGSIRCANVLTHCQQNGSNIPRCVENMMRNCGKSLPRGFHSPDFYLRSANSSSAARVDTDYGHVIYVPSEAVLKSKRPDSENDVYLIVTVFNSSLFEAPSDRGSLHEQVLGVWLGDQNVHNLSNPVRIKFVNVSKDGSGQCVSWKWSNSSDQGSWSTDGCNTIQNNTDFVCKCNHISFFAVLISPDVPEPADVQHLEYCLYMDHSTKSVQTSVP
ncbi:adhesion G-protein coupled receptor G1-like [Colossoma macropomum]|uniref:adhesion G-protein coupled receptor G1-like n=1 Tax=Colossoma macropomum TaxID=42526 RepID=UPI0018640486|nr:adhesion G-protein coupled receptor G1-like [Colossoma macropomum]